MNFKKCSRNNRKNSQPTGENLNLKVGDVIKCASRHAQVWTMYTLLDAGCDGEFLQSNNGVEGYYILVTEMQPVGNITDRIMEICNA